MSNDLEELVRRTLHERAGEVETGPQWVRGPRRSRRWPVLVAAASVALIAGAGALWRTSAAGPEAGGRTPTACTATLPAAWRTALDPRPITVDGDTVPVDGVLRDGSAVVETIGGHYPNSIVLVSPAGRVTSLYKLPAGGFGLQVDVDDPYVVLSISTGPTSKGVERISDTTQIVAVDTRTRRTSDVLRDAPTGLRPPATAGRSAKDAVSDGVVQGDTVYWTVASTAGSAGTGIVVGYDLTTHRYRQVGTYRGSGGIGHDAQGVWWSGGSVAAPGLPQVVAALSSGTSLRSVWDETVKSDGKDFAWADVARRVVHWAGPNGRAASYAIDQLDTADGPGFDPIVGVAGPFVLMFTTEDSATYHLLDTRTGALADTHIGPGGSAYALGSTLYLARPVAESYRNSAGTVVVDTAKLPELRC